VKSFQKPTKPENDSRRKTARSRGAGATAPWIEGSDWRRRGSAARGQLPASANRQCIRGAPHGMPRKRTQRHREGRSAHGGDRPRQKAKEKPSTGDGSAGGFGLGLGWLNRAASAAWRVLTPPTAVADKPSRTKGNAIRHTVASRPREGFSGRLTGRVTTPVNAVSTLNGPASTQTRERSALRQYTAPAADAVGRVFVQSGGWFCLGLHGFVWFGVVLFLSAAPTETLGKSGLEI
jgi:hypothetical protein